MFKYIFCFFLSVFTSSSPCRKDQFAVSYCSAKWPCPSQLSYEDMKIIYVNCAVKNQMKDDHLIVAIYKLLQLRKHIQRPAPSWLGRLVERCAGIVEVKGWNPVQG